MNAHSFPRRFSLAAAAVGGLLLASCTFLPGPTSTLPPPPQATATQPLAAPPTDTVPAVVDTVAPPPSDTPAPTATSEPPSATPSPIGVENTATTPAPATPDPNEAVGDIIYQDFLDGNGGWFWTFADDVSSFGVDSGRGQLKAVMSQTGAGWRFTISPDTLRLGNQQVRLVAHTETCAENDEYGLMFRASADPEVEFSYNMYLFKLRCGGGASVQLVQGSDTTTLVDWTPSSAIQAGPGVANNLMVWMSGSEFRFYVNEQYLFSAQDTTYTDGFFGIYIYDRTAGGATVYFEDLIARTVNR